MAFKQWLIGLLGGQAKNSPDQTFTAPPSSDPDEEEVEGLNFRTAIEVHQKWKSRLQAVIDGADSKIPSIEEVSSDNQCLLGKWIYSVGNSKFGHEDLFKTLKKDHAHFHNCAGKVLQTALAGNKAEAQTALKTGDFAKASQMVFNDLAQMYIKLGK